MKIFTRRNFVKNICAGCLLLGIKISEAGNQDIKAQSQVKKMQDKSSLCDEIEILFLGTGAADWPRDKYPSDVNKLLRGDHRGLSSALINKKILIDCGPTVLLALEKINVDVNLITDIIITHTHSDHFSLEVLVQLLKKRLVKVKINIWLEESAVFKTEKLSGYNIHPLTVMNTFYVPDFEIVPLCANHKVEDSHEKPLHYLFKAKNKTFFYALDGAWLMTETWREIKKEKLDAIIWDATIGQQNGDYRIFEHNSLDMIRYMNQTLRSNGVLKDSSRILLSHMARTLHSHQVELKKTLLPEKIIPAHDGMVVFIR